MTQQAAAPDRFAIAAHLASQALRTGWYVGLRQVLDRLIDATGRRPPPVSVRGPMPTTRALLGDLLALHLEEARHIGEGLYPLPLDHDASLRNYLATARALIADLPTTMERQERQDAREAARLPAAASLPDYFVQNFHYQTGGYLTAESARLYDAQVETLFRGAANAMRRQAFKPIAAVVRGRDQRRLALLDVACGTGRFLGQLAQAFPALPMTGIDLSAAYLEEAARHLRGRRTIRLLQANAERLPFADQSQDIVTCIYLFHELPQDVRRLVAAEMGRVLKPGGLLVFIDSLQTGDRPDWDGLLEAFPVRFHEPYYANYIGDDLDGVFAAAGLQADDAWTAFLSKIMTRRKAAS